MNRHPRNRAAGPAIAEAAHALAAPGRSAIRHRRRGAALVAVMWIVLLAGLVLMGVNRAAGIHFAVSHGELAMVQARWLARAGVEQAVAILEDDITGVDSPLDWWYEDPVSFQEVELPTGQFSVIAPADERTPRTPRYGLLDASSRVHAGVASEGQLAAIPGIDPAVVDAIIDWRDPDENPRPGGAERGYYQGLDFPYEIRNGPFRTHEELLLVKGIDRKTFYGEDVNGNGIVDGDEAEGDPATRGGLAAWTDVYGYEPNTDAGGATRLNVNRADPAALQQRLKFTPALAMGLLEHRSRRGDGFQNLMELLEVQPRQGVPAPQRREREEQVERITLEWLAANLDRLTTQDEERLPARINLNTAPRAVLLTLPGMTPEAADSIMAFRDSSKGPLESVGDLVSANIVDPAVFRAIAELVTVRSGVFRVTCIGTAASGVRCTVRAVIDRNADPPVVYWRESE